ncbi:MAG: hypothetical protein V1858_02680 [Candidatus Gottesmanbacteria bacterium]
MPPSIFNKFLPKTPENKEYFIALQVCPEKIKAAACEISSGEVSVLAHSTAIYTGGWEEATAAADQAISQVETNFPPNIEVNKVVLGLPTEYTKDGKIEETQLVNIKNLLKKLLLVPLGFVEIPLSMIHFLEKQQGGPQTLILVRIGQQLNASLVRIGKITNNISVPRTDNVALDLEKAIASFTSVEILPSKILLFDGQDLEHIQQTLMSYPWVTRAAFLHFPKIEIAPEDLDIKSIAFAGASEIAQVVEMADEKKEDIEVKEENPNLGFIKNEDILDKQPVVTTVSTPQPQDTIVEETVVPPVPQPESSQKINPFKIKLLMFLSLFSRIGSLKNRIKIRFPLPLGNKITLIAILIVFLILILGAGFVAASWYYPTAQVSLLLKPQVLEQSIDVALNSKIESVNEVNKEVPVLAIEVDEKATKKTNTTAKKTVGEPAKGEVTLYNKTGNSKIFKQGTILISPNNLHFTLDDEITIASASENVGSLTFGKQNAKITASAIGPQGNLGVGQEFHFADYPTTSYSARNEIALSGGTSREVSVVGKDDQGKLLASASDELTQQAKKDLMGKVGKGEKIIDQTLKGTISSQKFDKEVNDEATELALDLSMHFVASGVRDNDLLSILENNLSSSVPSGFEFKRDNVTIGIGELTKKKDGSQSLKVNFSVNLLPRINQDEIRKNLIGKDLTAADSYLRSLGNIAGYEINFSRSLPFGKKILPRISKNISIETNIGK